jgi:hypothetical protein
MRSKIVAALLSGALGFSASSSHAIAQARGRDVGAPQGTAAPAVPRILTAGSNNASSDRQVYSSIKELMDSIVDPSADVLWGAVGTIADKDGIHELLPKTPEDWLDLRRAAVRIIEGSNLLTMPGREAAPVGTKSEVPGVELEPAQMTALINRNRKSFNAFARELQVLGVEALRASDTKNTISLIDIGGRMEDVCESCHKTFWYPQEKPAPARK